MNKIKIKAVFPFDPAKSPIFYGWIVMVAGTIGILASTPGQTIGVSVFTEHLIKAFGLSRNQLTLAYGFGTVGSSFFLTRMGRSYDKLGARVIIIGASLALALMLFYLTLIDNISIYLHQKVPVASNWLVIGLVTLGFFGIRFFGQGTLTMISRNMVMKWFDKRRGLANMFMGFFVAIGFSAMPKVFNGMINHYNWQGAWLIIAVIIGGAFTLFALVFFRDNPEDAGLIPDGIIKVKKTKRKEIPTSVNFSLTDARKTYNFWFYNMLLCLNGFYLTAYYFHIESIFVNKGYELSVAVSILIPSALIAGVISIVSSFVSDFIKLKNLAVLNAIGIVVSVLSTIYMQGSPQFIKGIIIGNGLLNGTFSVISALIWPRFFGTKFLGEVSGFALSFTVFASGIAPFLFSFSNDVYNSYNPILFICLILSILILVFSFKAVSINEKGLKL